MPYALLSSIKETFTDRLIGIAAVSLDENEKKVRKAINMIVPVVLNRVLCKTREVEENAGIFFMAKRAAATWDTDNIKYYFSGNHEETSEHGMFIANHLFESNVSEINDLVSQHAKIDKSSALALVNMAAYISFVKIGKYSAKHNLNAGEFEQWISGRRNVLIDPLPYDINLTSGLRGTAFRQYAVIPNLQNASSLFHFLKIRKIKRTLKNLLIILFPISVSLLAG